MGRGPLARAEPCGMGLRRDGAAGLGGRHVLEDTSHRFHLQLLPVHSLYLVEGGVGADDHEGGSWGKTGSSGPRCLPGPHCPPRHRDLVLTHLGPRRRRIPRQPARRRERRRPRPGHTDGRGSPLGLGGQMALGQLFHTCPLSQSNPQNALCQGPPSPAPAISPASPPTVP